MIDYRESLELTYDHRKRVYDAVDECNRRMG